MNSSCSLYHGIRAEVLLSSPRDATPRVAHRRRRRCRSSPLLPAVAVRRRLPRPAVVVCRRFPRPAAASQGTPPPDSSFSPAAVGTPAAAALAKGSPAAITLQQPPPAATARALRPPLLARWAVAGRCRPRPPALRHRRSGPSGHPGHLLPRPALPLRAAHLRWAGSSCSPSGWFDLHSLTWLTFCKKKKKKKKLQSAWRRLQAMLAFLGAR